MKSSFVKLSIPKFSFGSLVLFLSLIVLVSCERSQSSSEGNALKEYVNEPKEKAAEVKEKVEAVQNAAAEQAQVATGDSASAPDTEQDEGEEEDSEEESGE